MFIIDDLAAMGLAIVKIVFNVAFAIVTAIPFTIAWNAVAPIYLCDVVPCMFLIIPYWHIVGMLLICTFLGEQIQKLTPSLINMNVSNANRVE